MSLNLWGSLPSPTRELWGLEVLFVEVTWHFFPWQQEDAEHWS